MSFRAAATVMFDEGDIERANIYLKKSIADANFYAARMRNAQSAMMLPIIDDAYSNVQKNLNGRLRSLLAVSSCLAGVLLVTLILIWRQFRSIRRAKDRLTEAHAELARLSDELRLANSELKIRNEELSAFNRTKEQYAGLFMEHCSSAISTLQHSQQAIRNLINQGAARTAILKKLDSSGLSDDLLKNFYARFDEAILNIYPDFVERFNKLLRPEERINLKNNELLNTELRLFALVRIGIEDTAKIAQFLRCSSATIYTYRSKMKKRALDPDAFEDNVRNL